MKNFITFIKWNPIISSLLFVIFHLPKPQRCFFGLSATQPLLHQNSESVQVVNFWATWCAPCIKNFPISKNSTSWRMLKCYWLAWIFPNTNKKTDSFVEKHKLNRKLCTSMMRWKLLDQWNQYHVEWCFTRNLDLFPKPTRVLWAILYKEWIVQRSQVLFLIQ